MGFGFIEPKKLYRIDPSHGSCSIKISGTEGTTFDLVERLPNTWDPSHKTVRRSLVKNGEPFQP